MNARLPTAADEGQHTADLDIPHWSESWYFDGVSDDGTLGVYTRIGRVPGSDTCLYTAAVVRPDGPTVLVVDAAAPLPDDAQQSVDTDAFAARQECLEPLERFRVVLDGEGRLHHDHAGPLRAEPGEPIEVSLDLVWQTDATPYRWSLTDRYEVPCRVSGTVRVGEETVELAGPGQRDHSWGPRDWWGHEWMWSAFHLDDGSRIHAVGIAELPGLIIGYVQDAEGLHELSAGSWSVTVGDDGLDRCGEIRLDDVDLVLEVEPTGFGPLRLVADDGRVTHFNRAMATVRTSTGATGTGWIEWNHLQA